MKLLNRSPYLKDIQHQISTYIPLPDAQPEVFSIYQQWLYTRGLYTKMVVKEAALGSFHSSHRDEWTKLTESYLLGHKLADIDFRDRVIDGMLEWLNETTNYTYDLSMVVDNIAQIYAALKDPPEDHPLRRLISDIVSLEFTDAMIQKMVIDRKGELPGGFLLNLVSKLSAKSGTSTPSSNCPKLPELREACHYHCHGKGECYREK
ncbi:hypothetical protein PMIN06_009179 [Paraphaeosphaeria minitans]|uniref:Uncharacterized protein n=1 Tax=Paraphaeosphaeria minitans TaxID=565426 RepID=A0A9P6KUQ0_9PLEO|nr:hypothetical protein PMIN01_02231 [Paraphaeosphaeria minitans]